MRKMKKRSISILMAFLLAASLAGGFTLAGRNKVPASYAAEAKQTAASSSANAVATSAEQGQTENDQVADSSVGNNTAATDENANGAVNESDDAQAADGAANEGESATADGRANEEGASTADGAANVDGSTAADDSKPEGIYLVGGANAYEVNLTRPASPLRKAARAASSQDVPEHHKTLTQKKDENGNVIEDMYTLTLDIKGMVEVSEKPKVDVLLIVDKSGSMRYRMSDNNEPGPNESSRMQILKGVVTGAGGLTDTLLGTAAKENLDARIAVVSYSGDKYNNPEYDTPHNDATQVLGWTDRKTTVDSAINGITANGGTNCEAGLRTGAETLGSARTDAAKYVIFLTDGEPTLFYANGSDYGYNNRYDYHKYTAGVTLGHGNEDGAGSNGRYDYIYDDKTGKLLGDGCCSQRAYDQLAAIKGLTGFYSIAFSSAGSTDFTTGMLDHTDATHKAAYSGTDIQGVIDAFKEIGRSITSLTGASIHDTMSKYADVVIDGSTFDAGDDYTLHVKDANGNEVEGEAAKAFDEATLNGKQLTLKFKQNYALNPNYTYSISFDIKPSHDAYKELLENGEDCYKSPAGDGTGYFSNAGAYISYDFGNQHGVNVNYEEKPTFSLATKQITVNKAWKDMNGKDLTVGLPDSVSMKLTGKREGQEDVTKPFDVKSGEGWTKTITVPKNYFTYEVAEDPETPGFDVAVTGDANSRENPEVTVTNTQRGRELTVVKKTEGGFADESKEFDITCAFKENGQDKTQKFSLKNGASGTVKVPYGAEVTITEADYSPTYTLKSMEGKAKGENGEETAVGTFADGTYTVTIAGDTTVTVTNQASDIPATGLFKGDDKWWIGAGVVGLIAVLGLAVYFLEHRSRRRYKH